MELDTVHTALVALYLRGAPRAASPNRRLWPQVVRALRDEPVPLSQVSPAFRARGWHLEATLLEEAALLDWAERHQGHALTPVSAEYPLRWQEALGAAAPPAVWARGEGEARRLLGVVGSRQVGGEVLDFAGEVGRQSVLLGYGVVSGGAEGCDRAGTGGALAAGGTTVTVLPCGLAWSRPGPGLELSVCAPEEPFSTANAMERNALIYAASDATVVAHARFRTGGTWHGAADALRRRLTTMIVREDATPAHRAMVALGAIPLATPADLETALQSLPAQGALFGMG